MKELDKTKIDRVVLLGKLKINKKDNMELKLFCLKYFNLYFDTCLRNLKLDNYEYMVKKVTEKYNECNTILHNYKVKVIEKEYLSICLLELELENAEQLEVLKTYKNTNIKDSNYGYVYIVSNLSFDKNIYKIGCTKNVPNRIATLSQTSTPYEYKLELLIKTAQGQQRNMEQYLHSLFDEFRVNKKKEFFRLEMEDVLTQLNKCGIEYIRYT